MTPEERNALDKVKFLLNRDEKLLIYGVLASFVRYNIAAGLPGGTDAMVGFNLRTNQFHMILAKVATDVPPKALCELILHELLHVMCGHIDSVINAALRAKYPKDVVAIATDFVVNQYCDAEAYVEERNKIYKRLGEPTIIPATIQRFEFEPQLTVNGYCELIMQRLKENKDKDIGDNGWPIDIGGFEDTLGQSLDEKPENDNASGSDKQPTLQPCSVESKDVAKRARELIREELNRILATADAVSNNKARGTLPGYAAEYIEALMQPPQITYESIIRYFSERYGKRSRQMSRRRPSRRHSSHFGRRRANSLKVLWVCDTSGSMDKDELGLAKSELDHLADSQNADIDIAFIDTRVIVPPFPYTGVLDEFLGRGGTDFSPLFEWLEEHPEATYDFIVFLTDGMGCAPDEQKFPTLWILTPQGYTEEVFREKICEWGEVFKLKPTKTTEVEASV